MFRPFLRFWPHPADVAVIEPNRAIRHSQTRQAEAQDARPNLFLFRPTVLDCR